MTFANCEAALRHLIPQTTVAAWGWEHEIGPLTLPAFRMGRPLETTRLTLDAGGLNMPYVLGLIEVDFAERSVTFIGNNAREGCDEFEDVVHPSDEWWDAAKAIEWPLPVESGEMVGG